MDNFTEKVNDIAQNVHDQNSTTDQFAVSQTPYHTHNGSDSQRIPFIGLSDVPVSYWKNSTTNYAGASVIVNSTATGLTFSAGTGKTFVGIVSSNAAGAFFPAGWSVAHTGTGLYTITHTIGNTNYAPFATPFGQLFPPNINSSLGATTFELGFSDTSGHFQDTDFVFLVVIP
jgi:hypothetical protein